MVFIIFTPLITLNEEAKRIRKNNGRVFLYFPSYTIIYILMYGKS